MYNKSIKYLRGIDQFQKKDILQLKSIEEKIRIEFDIPPRFRVIIPKPIIPPLNLTIIVLSLVFKRTPKVLFWCEPHGQGV